MSDDRRDLDELAEEFDLRGHRKLPQLEAAAMLWYQAEVDGRASGPFKEGLRLIYPHIIPLLD